VALAAALEAESCEIYTDVDRRLPPPTRDLAEPLTSSTASPTRRCSSCIAGLEGAADPQRGIAMKYKVPLW